jgi:beta-hydroxylase
VEDNVARFPVTAAWLRKLPGLRAASFSVLGPGARIPPHRGANNGVLRSHLGVVVPGAPGDGVLEVGSCRLAWEEGRAFAFDDSYVHAAHNGAATERVVLMLETDRPTEGRTDRRNRLVQRAFAAHPQVRGGDARIREVDAAVNPG